MALALRNPVSTLAWEILYENRVNFWVMLGLLLPAWLLKSNGAFDATEALALLMAMSAFLIVFLTFTRTEANPRRDRKGFPERQFTLPVSTLTLVSVPLLLGVVVAELVFFALLLLDLLPMTTTVPLWSAAKLASWMLTYQMLLWCTASLGAIRMLLIGFVGFGFIILGQSQLSTVLLAVWSAAAFLLSWLGVARQRCGASRGRTGFSAVYDRVLALLPGRSRPFASMQQAQLWYEWRRSGFLLPLIVCTVLLAVVLPQSLVLDNPRRTLVLLIVTLLLPVLMAAPVGKFLAKADTASAGMAVPAFLAVRPLSANDVVVSKMQAAAIATGISWIGVLAFVVIWQFGWADTTALRVVGQTLWAMQHHSLVPQFAIALLLLVFLVLLTWRFLVAGLWIGLSGSGKLFSATTLLIALVPTVGLILLDEFFTWLFDDPARLRPFVWCVGVGVAAKFWLAAYTWRDVTPALTRRYLRLWLGGTLCMAALALLLAEPLGLLFNIELALMRSLLLFAALLVLPLAQLGLAPTQFARNRHG